MPKTGAIVLAAGQSRRLGGIKPLLPYQGKTLLQHTIDALKSAGINPVIVVTGAYASEIKAALDPEGIDLVYNEHWAQGKASGIVMGLQTLIARYPDIQQIIFAVCDQPFVSASLFQQLIEKQQITSKNIVASAYADTLGIPMLITQEHFPALLQLKDDEGAKKLLKQYPEAVDSVDFPLGQVDIDTMEDYARLLVGDFGKAKD